MKVGDIITHKEPKYSHQKQLYVVLGGKTDQNGLGFHVISYDCGLQTVMLDREVKHVGQLSGDAFYELKDKWFKAKNPKNLWHAFDEELNKAVYLAELTSS